MLRWWWGSFFFRQKGITSDARLGRSFLWLSQGQGCEDFLTTANLSHLCNGLTNTIKPKHSFVGRIWFLFLNCPFFFFFFFLELGEQWEARLQSLGDPITNPLLKVLQHASNSQEVPAIMHTSPGVREHVDFSMHVQSHTLFHFLCYPCRIRMKVHPRQNELVGCGLWAFDRFEEAAPSTLTVNTTLFFCHLRPIFLLLKIRCLSDSKKKKAFGFLQIWRNHALTGLPPSWELLHFFDSKMHFLPHLNISEMLN